jgi:plastocyanin
LHWAILIIPSGLWAGTIRGKVNVDGPTPKQKVIDMSKESDGAKDYQAINPPKTETATTGTGNTLADVVVYISAGANDEGTVPSQAVTLDQRGCKYISHVTVLHVKQEMKVTNNDPVTHNVHALAVANREWSKSQTSGAQPLDTKFEQPEFIPVKCNIHPWMHAYIVVLTTNHFGVTDTTGGFSLKC